MILLREYDIIYGTLIIDEGMSDERLFLSDSSERPSYIYICMKKKYTLLTVLGVCMRDIFVVRGKGYFLFEGGCCPMSATDLLTDLHV